MTAGFIAGIIISIVLFAVGIALTMIGLRWRRTWQGHKEAGTPSYEIEDHSDEWDAPFGIGVFLALGGLILAFVAMFPFDSQYYTWTEVSGEVERVDSRLMGIGGSSASEAFIVVIDGQQYRVDDSRGSIVEAGDDLTITCRREFQWAGEHGYGCVWGQR